MNAKDKDEVRALVLGSVTGLGAAMVSLKVRSAAATLGAMGGKTTGASKARGDSDHYRALARKRWKTPCTVCGEPAVKTCPTCPSLICDDCWPLRHECKNKV